MDEADRSLTHEKNQVCLEHHLPLYCKILYFILDIWGRYEFSWTRFHQKWENKIFPKIFSLMDFSQKENIG